MQLKKTSSILIFSVLLIIVAVGLLGASVYFLLESHNKTVSEEKPLPLTGQNAVSAQTVSVKDTSANIITEPTQVSDKPLSTDSVNIRLNEIYAMKKELAANAAKPGNVDTTDSRKKITELLEKVEQLKTRTSKVETENKYLKQLLEQLTDELKTRRRNLDQPISGKAVGPALARNTNRPALSELHFAFINDNQKEVAEANDAVALSAAFQTRTNSGTNVFYIVVLRPDGKTLQASSWDGGIFETAEGRKIYSYKVASDGNETQRRISFSMPAENLQKGNYTMQVYCNGILVGRASRSLI